VHDGVVGTGTVDHAWIHPGAFAEVGTVGEERDNERADQSAARVRGSGAGQPGRESQGAQDRPGRPKVRGDPARDVVGPQRIAHPADAAEALELSRTAAASAHDRDASAGRVVNPDLPFLRQWHGDLAARTYDDPTDDREFLDVCIEPEVLMKRCGAIGSVACPIGAGQRHGEQHATRGGEMANHSPSPRGATITARTEHRQ
jgi:hypothetical protein